MNRLREYLQNAQDAAASDVQDILSHIEAFTSSLFPRIGAFVEHRDAWHLLPREHSAETERLCAELIPPHRLGEDGGNQINVAETGVLIGACWLHMIGVGEPGPEMMYPLRSRDLVWHGEGGYSQLNLSKGYEDFLSAIATVCYCHRNLPKADGSELRTLREFPATRWRNKEIRPDMLGAILRTAFLLEVQYSRSRDDLPREIPEDLKNAWVEQTLVSDIRIHCQSGAIIPSLSEPAKSTPSFEMVARAWCEHLNKALKADVAWLYVRHHFPYGRSDIAFARPTDGESADSSTNLDRFREDAREIQENWLLGFWQLLESADGQPRLERRFVDKDGQMVTIQIVPTAAYPREPPVVKAVPRPNAATFSRYGQYRWSSSLTAWNERQDDGLFLLCNELRSYENPEGTFRAHAQAIARDSEDLDFVQGTDSLASELKLWVETGRNRHEVSLQANESYPQAPPSVVNSSGLLVPDCRKRAKAWEAWLKDGVDSPLDRFIRWLRSSLTSQGT